VPRRRATLKLLGGQPGAPVLASLNFRLAIERASNGRITKLSEGSSSCTIAAWAATAPVTPQAAQILTLPLKPAR